MDRDYKKAKSSTTDSSYSKSRTYGSTDGKSSYKKYDNASNGDFKKTKFDSTEPVKDLEREAAIKPEKIQASSDNAVVKELGDANKLENFEISKETIKHLNSLGYTHLFPIQAATYDIISEGNDLIGRDKTGSGKTLSYALPICEKLRREKLFKKKYAQKPHVLVVLPTRELVIQVTNTFHTLKTSDDEFRIIPVYGGTDLRTQIQEVKAGCEIVVGAPGRIKDLLEREVLKLSDLKVIVLDEADLMLDMGFDEDVEIIYKQIHAQTDKENVQSLLFSATLPSWVHEVSKKYLRENLQRVDLLKGKEIKTPSTVKHLAINCPYTARNGAIGDIVLCYGGSHCRTIIFTETKKEANEIMLEAHIKQECQVLHGDIPQKQREITFRAFREGKFRCLIATNVAARGLDIPEVDLIVQLAPPKDIETYIHRAGRTARAGRSGVCVTFYSKSKVDLLERIERKANIKFVKTGAPQPADIIKATSRDIVHSIKKVPNEVIDMFKDFSKELIDEFGAEIAMAKALAIISGTNEMFKQRSLLSSIEGFITYLVETDNEYRAVSYIWGFLKRAFNSEITDEIKGMRCYKNRKGAAFDVPEKYDQQFRDYIESDNQQKGFILKKAETLPEFEDEGGYRNNSFGGSSSGGYQRNGGGYGNRDGGHGNRDGGYGNRDGGYGNRDGGSKSVFKGKDSSKVFVGGLPYDVGLKDVEEFFKSDGLKPIDSVLLKDNEGKSKGIAFVIFDSKTEADKACKLSGKRMGGRFLRINMADEKPGSGKRDAGKNFDE